jgi:large subunit ribosomal protein L32e
LTERLLRVRARQKSKKPEFRHQDSHKKKKVGESWRKPRGLHSKLRRQIAAKGKLVKIGYGSPKAVKGYHPCGLREVLILCADDLDDAEGCAIRISGKIGWKKRLEIEEMARERDLKILNPKTGGE